MPDYRRYYQKNSAVFITIVSQNRDPILINHNDLILNAMHNVKDHYLYRHIAHVILPDHIHWMFEPQSKNNFSVIVAAMKREVIWRLKRERY